MLVRALSLTNQKGLMSRAGIVSSLEEIVQKAIWFITVLKESIEQIISSFVGCNAFLSPWMHYLLYFKSNIIEIISMIFALVLIVAGVINIWKQYRMWGILNTIAMLPLSYYVFLILSESSYTSYYAVGLCSVILMVMIFGAEFVFEKLFNIIKIEEHLRKQICCLGSIVICFIMVWNGNYYMRNFWVRYNAYGYTYLKQTIADNYDNETRIHILGTLYPGQADVYSTSAVRMACKELGIDLTNIEVTSSTNDQYIVNLSLEVYEYILTQLSEKDKEFMENSYIIDTAFSVCTLNAEKMSDRDYRQLERIMKEVNVIPTEGDGDTLIVDIRGVNKILLY